MALRRVACLVSSALVITAVAAHPSQPPAVSQQTSAVSQQTSAGSQQPSAGSQQPSAVSQQPSAGSQQPSAVSYRPSAADQLSALLGPVVESAVSRAQSGWQLGQVADRLERLQAGAEAGQRALAELTRHQARLETLAQEVSALRQAVLAGGGRGDVCQPPSPERETAGQQRRQETETEPETKANTGQGVKAGDISAPPGEESESTPAPDHVQTAASKDQEPATCQERPSPLPSGAAVYREPPVRACNSSCLQLRRRGVTEDGVYWLRGLPVPVFCDFSHDGGGWTLLLTAVSRRGWDPLSVMERRQLSPSLTDDYSILRYADDIRDLGTGGRFAYRIESQAEKGRQRWGGIWFAPRHYSFVDETGTQTDVSLVRRFDDWIYKGDGIKRRMPWINTGGLNPYRMHPVLTTASKTEWWGTLVTHHTYTRHNHSPWYNPDVTHSGTMLYWMREDALP